MDTTSRTPRRLRPRPRLRALGAAAVVAGIAAATPTTADAAWPGVNGRIAFTQRVPAMAPLPANRDVFAAARDGAVTRLTSERFNDEQSSWSPDGLQVAFKRTNEIFVLRDIVTGRQVQITSDPGAENPFNTQPAWSPDGRTIILRSSRQDPTRREGDIWLVNADPQDPAYGELRHLLARPGDERYPAFSPDGTRIAFRGDADGLDRTGDEELYVMDADGTDVRALTGDDAIDTGPAWSPDGTRLAFESTRDGADNEIYVMDLASGLTTRLTDNDVHDEGPAWSPDGRLMAFTRADTVTANGDIWTMRADGSEQTPLLQTPIAEESPDWQPIPFTAGAPELGRTACGDLSIAPGGVASVVAVKVRCERALDVAARWQAAVEDGRHGDRVGAFDCESGHHSFDQVLVTCEHRGGRKALAFVWRVPASAPSSPEGAS
jgi:TolB protein